MSEPRVLKRWGWNGYAHEMDERGDVTINPLGPHPRLAHDEAGLGPQLARLWLAVEAVVGSLSGEGPVVDDLDVLRRALGGCDTP